MTTLQERIADAIADFSDRAPDWDVTITDYAVEPSKRGAGPGMSIYVFTRGGMGFEVELQPGDDMTSVLGAPMH